MKLWKVLNPFGQPAHGGTGHWPAAGEWLEVPGELVPCANGLHLCRREDLVCWLGPEIWEVEHDGDLLHHDNKVVVRKARLIRQVETWNEKTARLFACDCAEHVLPLYERIYPDDIRPRRAIETARAHAEGRSTAGELTAAWAVSWADAGAAAWAAARAAWDAARSARYAARAAWDAARSAAWAAASVASDAVSADAEGAAERAWQTERLFSYIYPDASEKA